MHELLIGVVYPSSSSPTVARCVRCEASSWERPVGGSRLVGLNCQNYCAGSLRGSSAALEDANVLDEFPSLNTHVGPPLVSCECTTLNIKRTIQVKFNGADSHPDNHHVQSSVSRINLQSERGWPRTDAVGVVQLDESLLLGFTPRITPRSSVSVY